MTEPATPQTDTAEGETFISHLIELRTRLVRAAAAFLVVFLGLMYFSKEIYDLLAYPMLRALPEGAHMIAVGVLSPFVVQIKTTMMAALVIALPYILYQAWAFIAPGLYAHEKKMALPIVVSTYLLFLTGMAFCYFFVFGTVFKVIQQYAPTSVTVSPDIESYFSFVMSMFLAFGATFEVPVVVLVLVQLGLISVAKLKQIRPYVVVGAFGIAAVVTPPDPVSMLLLGVPLWLLYEVGIFAAGFLKPRTGNEVRA